MDFLKLFSLWNGKKQEIHFSKNTPEFSDGEIWWASLGQNISTEIFGKGNDFLRPVVILRKVFSDACVVIPLTSKGKKGSYYFHFLDHENISQYAILHQVRYLDSKRMKYKMGNMKQKDFQNLQNTFCLFIKNNPTIARGEPQRGKLS